MPDRESNLGPLALSQTLSLMIYAKFQYSLNVLFCELTENCEHKRKLYMYRVSEFRSMLTFTNYGPLKRNADLALLSSNPTGIGIRHTANGAPKNFIIVLIICIFFLTFLEPLIHDSKHGNKSEIK